MQHLSTSLDFSTMQELSTIIFPLFPFITLSLDRMYSIFAECLIDFFVESNLQGYQHNHSFFSRFD